MEARSRAYFLFSSLDVNTWLARPPSVDLARPPCCPACNAPSRPPGAPLGLHGHGLRSRQLWGPLTPEGPAQQVVLSLRRYRCLRCGAVMTVAPRGVLPHRLFTAGAIAMALALWALLRLAAHVVRGRINPARVVGPTAASGWLQLRRWARSLPTLFPTLRVCAQGPPRLVAAQAASALAGDAPPSLRAQPLEVQAFAGGASRR